MNVPTAFGKPPTKIYFYKIMVNLGAFSYNTVFKIGSFSYIFNAKIGAFSLCLIK